LQSRAASDAMTMVDKWMEQDVAARLFSSQVSLGLKFFFKKNQDFCPIDYFDVCIEH
jgi:primase-polymerase (primpol)-like protein